MLQRHNICVHLNFSWVQAPACHIFLNVFDTALGKKFPTGSAVNLPLQNCDRICFYSAFISGRIQVHSRQEQDTANRNPFIALQICLRDGNWLKVCSKIPSFEFLHCEEGKTQRRLALCVQSVLCWVHFQIMNCSHDPASWKIYFYRPHVSFGHWETLS